MTEISLNFDLVNSMCWMFFMGMSITLGAGVGLAILAFFQQKLKPKEDSK